ncbi:MAG: DEAD/DEAH box helicase [Opitutaceae bacterium]|nr:DEAD/DEAH box helicase [Opitutaceae bacterium]
MTSADTTVTFTSLNLAEPLLRALAEKNYTHPSPIQAQAIPHLLQGRDIFGCAQTGTGKTAAFALPILQLLDARPKARTPGRPRVLILTPTRELAAQIGDNIALYGKHLKLRHTVIFGGVGQQPQVDRLQAGVDIVVATPGRLLDLMGQGAVRLDQIEIFVLDEADRMLDMGFAPDVKRVIQRLPAKRQSLLFSATMPQEIRDIAANLLRDPIDIAVTPVATTAERIDQRVMFVQGADKHRLLVHVLEKHDDGLVLVFTRTKHGANRLVQKLDRDGIPAAAIHGNKSQGARTRALDDFRTGRTRVLVATDIAARGIDVKGIGLVVNFDLPNEPEAYVHRIGRTARAGADGLAISFCSPDEREYLRDIQRLIRQDVAVEREHPFSQGGGGAGSSHAGDRAPSQPSRGGRAAATHPHPSQHRGDRRGSARGQGASDERRGRHEHRAQTPRKPHGARSAQASAPEAKPVEVAPKSRTAGFFSALFRGRR